MKRPFLPALRLLLAVLLLLSAGRVCYAVNGYWVLESTKLSKDSGKNPMTNKPYWRSLSKNLAIHSSGEEIRWADPPEKIKFGDEANLGIRITISNSSSKMIQGYVSVVAMENGDVATGVPGGFRWGDASYQSGVRSRHPDVDMQMDLFVPNRKSTLVIAIGGQQLAAVAGGSFNPAIQAAQYYYYKFVGDDPVYNYETEATDKPGEFGGTNIPPAVFWGPLGAVGAGVLVNRVLKKRKKKKEEEGDGEPDEKEKEKRPSSYRMILYKEFGDTLHVGDEPKVVGARIEEVTAEGYKKERPDLTETIQVFEGDNLEVLAVGMTHKYRCARIRVREPESDHVPSRGSVIFSFTGPSGVVRNKVVFKIEDNKKIVFCQDNITYVAGHHSDETVYFYVNGFGEHVSVEAQMENDKKQTFVLSRVRPDKEGSWSVDLTDTLTEEAVKSLDRLAGDVDSCYLVVTAREQLKYGERKVSERLPVHRFYEGLRLQVGHIKAYPVIKGTESISVTEEQPKDYEHQLAIAHTRLEVTLFAWDEQKNKIGSPAPDSMEITFEDIPESLEWFGKRKDEPITDPVSKLGLQLQDFAVDCRPVAAGLYTRTYIYEIVPSAIMVPPNRCKAAIKAMATFHGKTFQAEQTSMVISMPMRIPADMRELHDLQTFDKQVMEKYTHMRNTLLSRPQAPQLAALIYKCDIMIQSFDERFGFYMPEYYNAKRLFLKLMRGEVGPLYVAESTYVWEEVYFGDGFDMCMAAMSEREPKTVMGRLLLGLCTLGYSEMLYYTPKKFLLECKKASENENNTFFDNFMVGAEFATWEMLESAAFQKGMQWGMGKLSTTQFGQALAETADLVKKDLIAVEQTLCKNYSSLAYVSRLARSTHNVLNKKIDIRNLCKKKLDAGKDLLAKSPAMKELRDLAKEAQAMGEQKVKEFIRACKDPNIPPEELKKLVLSIQCDRWAKNYLNSSKVIDKYRFRFSTENTILHENVKKALRQKLAKEFGVHESQVTFFEATGNATKVNAVNCKKIGMDHDYTIRINGKDLPEEVAGRYWNDEYCFQATGSRNFSPWDADKLALQAEQTAVSFDGAESFGSDVGKVIDPKGNAATAFDDAQLVQNVQTYKVEEPLRNFEKLMKKAAAEPDAAWASVYRKEALQNLREACRQLPKGMDRTLEEKLKMLDQWGLTDKLDPSKLRAAQELRGRIENMLANTSEGDSQALIEFYASYKVEGVNLADESKKALSLITEVDNLIKTGPGLPEIETAGLNMTGAHTLEEMFKED